MMDDLMSERDFELECIKIIAIDQTLNERFEIVMRGNSQIIFFKL